MEELTNVEGQEEQVETQEENKTYSQDEVLTLLQKETDKRVTEALKKQEKKLQSKIAEAEKLSRMDAEQKAQYEFEQKIKEFESEKEAFEIERQKVSAMKVMSDRGLDVSLVEFIVTADAESTMSNIDALDKAFKNMVKKEVESRLKSPTPTRQDNKTIDKESFRALSVVEQQEIYKNNKELYMQLINN